MGGAPGRFVHYYPDAMGDSGVTVALWGWARATASAGCDVVVLHGESGIRPARESFVADRVAGISDVVVRHRWRHRQFRHPVALERQLRTGDLLILHEGWVNSNHVAARAAAHAGIPYLVVPHGVYEPAWQRYLRRPRMPREWLERLTLEHAAAAHLFFGSEAGAITALAPATRYIVAPTGTALPVEQWQGGGGYLAWIGRYDPIHKGLDLLFDALARVPAARRPHLRLRGYDYKGGLARLEGMLARHADLASYVDIGGPISGDEKRRFLLASDGYVLPSRWESHSMALVEVLALGIPSIVSGALHVAPMLEHHGAAVIVPPEIHALAEALERFAKPQPELGRLARSMVAAELSWKRVMVRYLDQVSWLDTAGPPGDLDREPVTMR